jgi:23S rRNA pseudouridine1911/1915/1917 synthase
MLEITLGTGRTHQIRVHMSYIGHPLLGDEKYGNKGPIDRPALHAKTIGFIHPATKKFMEFASDLPQDMKKLISKNSL